MLLTDTALDQYCRRIGFDGSPRADLATLQRLHALHPQAIPFENLDAWLGRPVILEPEHVLDKLVRQQRGGYCFEHNLLFMRVLRTLGFDVQGLSARVLWNLPADVVLPRTHMLLLVTVNDTPYIADVGFGGLTMTAALALDSTAVQSSPHEQFRLLPEAGARVVQARIGNEWQSLYRFSLEAQTLADYTMANWYVATHPQSRFVSHLIAGRVDHDGRHALLDRRYNRHYTGRDTDRDSARQQLESPAALRRLLEERLLIDTSALPGLDRRLAALFQEA